jgi:hypothetical protein
MAMEAVMSRVADERPDQSTSSGIRSRASRGAVALPSAFRPLEIGTDYLLGVSRDAEGVEQVVLYDLPPANH